MSLNLYIVSSISTWIQLPTSKLWMIGEKVLLSAIRYFWSSVTIYTPSSVIIFAFSFSQTSRRLLRLHVIVFWRVADFSISFSAFFLNSFAWSINSWSDNPSEMKLSFWYISSLRKEQNSIQHSSARYFWRFNSLIIEVLSLSMISSNPVGFSLSPCNLVTSASRSFNSSSSHKLLL